MSSERITPLFFDLEAHTLTKKNGCGAFMGVCLPSEWKISPSQYTLDYNVKLAKEFHKTLEEIGSQIEDNDLAYEFIKLGQTDELLRNYKKFEKKIIESKQNTEEYRINLHNKPKEYLEDSSVDFENIKQIIDENEKIINDKIDDLKINNKKISNNSELEFRIAKMNYFKTRNYIHFLIWKWGIWSMPLEWRAWLTWEWRHIEYIMENTFHYYITEIKNTGNIDNKYDKWSNHNIETIQKLLDEHKSKMNNLVGYNLLYSNAIIDLFYKQIEYFNELKKLWLNVNTNKKKQPLQVIDFGLVGIALFFGFAILK
jgi:hypothetical protein